MFSCTVGFIATLFITNAAIKPIIPQTIAHTKIYLYPRMPGNLSNQLPITVYINASGKKPTAEAKPVTAPVIFTGTFVSDRLAK